MIDWPASETLREVIRASREVLPLYDDLTSSMTTIVSSSTKGRTVPGGSTSEGSTVM